MPIAVALLPILLPLSAPVASSFQDGTELFRLDRLDDLSSYNPSGKSAPKLELFTSQGFSAAIRATVDNSGNPWETQFGRPSLAGVMQGDPIRFNFSARTTGTVTILAVFEQAEAPNEKIIYQSVGADGTWRDFQITRQANHSYAAGSTQVKFFFVGKGTAEIANVAVRRVPGMAGPFGVDDKLGAFKRNRDEALLKVARANIERLRKGKLALTVVGANGRPLANTKVRVTLDRHAFHWGTAVVADLLNATTPEARKYQAIVAKEFNTVVFENDLKWRDDSPAPLQAALKTIPWLKAHRIDVRGHNLVWGAEAYLPRVVKDAPNEKKWPIIEAHVREYASAMKGKVYVWDVVNEAVTNTALWEQVGWDKFAEVYKLTHQIDPNAKLAYNEYNIPLPEHRRLAIERVKRLQAAGAPVSVFGDQGHFGFPEPPASVIWNGWNEVAKGTGLPIEITEYDFGTPDDNYYAEQIEDTMTLAFGHPSIQAFLMWGFWEGAHWRANDGGAVVRRDFTYRLPMTRFHDLLHKTWSTDVTVTTDSKGRVVVPAFYGTYRVSAGTKKAVVEHPKGSTTAKVTLK